MLETHLLRDQHVLLDRLGHVIEDLAVLVDDVDLRAFATRSNPLHLRSQQHLRFSDTLLTDKLPHLTEDGDQLLRMLQQLQEFEPVALLLS
jgi:hypothetical protein